MMYLYYVMDGDILSKFLPNMYYESIFKINYKKLMKIGIKCILFDLDNTCVPYKEKNPSDDLEKLFKKIIKMGFKVIIFTNASRNRIEPFIRLGVDYNCNSFKPFSKNYRKVISKLGYKKDEVCIIGDQIFTDILGGNRVGIVTILVDPLSSDDLFITRFFRLIENIKFKSFEEKGLLKRGVYDE